VRSIAHKLAHIREVAELLRGLGTLTGQGSLPVRRAISVWGSLGMALPRIIPLGRHNTIDPVATLCRRLHARGTCWPVEWRHVVDACDGKYRRWRSAGLSGQPACARMTRLTGPVEMEAPRSSVVAIMLRYIVT
jgi:hypothetical protein